MKRLRFAIVIFFLVSAVLFVAAYVRRRYLTDRTPPVITADTNTLTVSITATDEDLMKGMTAFDNIDGDVTSKLVVVSRSKFIEKGVIHVNYAAFDSSRNVGTKVRTVTFEDYVSPRFHLYAPLRFPTGSSGIDYLENITAEDCIDGNLNSQIKISLGQTTAVSEAATKQKMDIQVTNSCGDNAVLELTVSNENYASYSTPSPALREYIAYVEKDGRISLTSYISGIWTAGTARGFENSGFDPARDISIDENGLDVSTPGVYTVTYQLFNTAREPLGTAELIVIVED
ncbi:MAG: hypothetical protein IIT70_01730 [Clostridia bacterium]|nr:hypothetical protein [Clostridia bacterium]MBQ5487561.1 hypothetical protein [Clostridia bacterium]MBR4634811.1 hypothetical protein [Clostridia bacterium]